MIRIDNYAIDADERCYIVREVKTNIDKETGKPKEVLEIMGYYTTLSHAFKAVLDDSIRKEIKEGDHDIKSALQACNRLESHYAQLLEKAIHENLIRR